MSRLTDKFRYEYGAQPLHLMVTAASLFLCAYALLRITEIPGGTRILIWIVAAALVHDLVAVPLYSGLSRLTQGAADRAIEDRAARLTALNHVRVPAALSLLLFVVYMPLILRFDPDRFMDTTGLSLDPYLGRWLLISGALFLISGAWYAFKLRSGAAKADVLFDGPPPVAAAGPDAAPLAAPLRIAGSLVLALTALVTLWVVATVVVGLVTNGL